MSAEPAISSQFTLTFAILSRVVFCACPWQRVYAEDPSTGWQMQAEAFGIGDLREYDRTDWLCRLWFLSEPDDLNNSGGVLMLESPIPPRLPTHHAFIDEFLAVTDPLWWAGGEKPLERVMNFLFDVLQYGHVEQKGVSE